jgi:SNF2 family DNA or RNA helicase
MVEVGFDDGSSKLIKTEAGVLQRVRFSAGDQVMRDDGQIGVILEQVTFGDYPTWKVSFPGQVTNIAEIGLRRPLIRDPVDRLRSGRLGTAEDFNLRSTAADYWFSNQHSALVSLAHARVDLKPHQISVVHRVVSNYPHRFALCDEVGLGKTIEAAMVIKELRARGQAQRVLILVPAGLMQQWQFELKTKFNEVFSIYNSGTLRYLKDQGIENAWMENNSIIASHTWASWNDERRREIAEVPWDMVVVDEAHHARARRDAGTTRTTHLYSLVNDLVAPPEAARRAVLLITATPLQLEHYELYSLCDMLNPALFSSDADFDEHMRSLSGLNRTVEQLEKEPLPKDEARLAELEEEVEKFLELEEGAGAELLRNEPQELGRRLRSLHRVSEVLIRNRKSVVGGFQPRRAVTWDVELSEREQRVHELMDGVFARGFARAKANRENAVGFQMVILQKLLASSSRALKVSLSKRRERLAAAATRSLTPEEAEAALEEDSEAAEVVGGLDDPRAEEIAEFDEIIAELKQIRTDSKAKLLRSNMKRLFGDDPDAKVLIFTEFRETQTMLQDLLAPLAEVRAFHGQLAAKEKDSAVAGFRAGHGPQVMVSTEAGGEGRNFQFCHMIVNYDLPWNPMKVEQRIGRVDRIGQEHPVLIFNFHVKGTIEGRILEVLERRINIFEDAVGGLDPILGEAEADIRSAVALAGNERNAAIDKLGLRLELEVERARRAEVHAADFIMDAKSFVAEVARKAAETEAPISQAEFEDFELALLRSAGTWIGPRDSTGERRICFHPPFTLEHPDLIAGQDARRVCFDPGLNTDSELVEYFGFGHPVIDALVRINTEERPDGAAAVRAIDPETAGIDRPGWQFNWALTVGGLSSRRFLLPMYVPDGEPVDLEAGARLLRLSREFRAEDGVGPPSLEQLDAAFASAQEAAAQRQDEELSLAQGEAAARLAIEEERTRALFDTRAQAAQDRIDSCRATLERLLGAEDRRQRQAIPLWEANLARAESELELIDKDRRWAMTEISKQSQPSAEFELLNIARIELVVAQSGQAPEEEG